MYTSLGRARPAFIGSTLAVAFSMTLVVGSIPAAAARNQVQAPCADPRGNSYCTDASPTPSRLVCCVNPNPLPAPKLTITPAAARVGERVVVEDSGLPQVDSPAMVFFEWESQDGTLVDANISSGARGPIVQLEFVVPPAPPETGVLCVRGVGFRTACTAFTILPETNPADLNPDPDHDPNTSWW